MRTNATELAAHLARITSAAPQIIARDAETLASKARTLRKIAEIDCNYGLTPAQERQRDILAQQAREIAQRYGLQAVAGGDPRGPCLYLLGLPGNSMGGDSAGFGVC